MSEPIFLSFCQARQELYPLLGLALVKADKSDSSIQCLCSSPAFRERWKKGQEEADGFLTGYDVGERRRKAKEKKKKERIHFFCDSQSHERNVFYLGEDKNKSLFLIIIQNTKDMVTNREYDEFLISRNNSLSTLFERILIVNKPKDSYLIVHRKQIWGEEKEKPGYTSRISDFSKLAVQPDDQDRFLLYRNHSFWKEKLRLTSTGFIKDFFRVKSIQNEFRWREVTIIERKDKGYFRICVGQVNNIPGENYLTEYYCNTKAFSYPRDGLTGLINRDGFERAESKIEKKREKTFVLISLDIDNFKVINDLYGHNVGDQVLAKRAKDLRLVFGYQNLISRTGGDEFSVLFTNKSYEELEPSIKKFANRPHYIHAGKDKITFTASIGVATYPKQATCLEDLRKRSDRALYEVKRNGKKNYALYNKDNDYFERSQIGFSFKDRNDDYPGGMLFYKIEEEKGNILFLNQARVTLSGFETIQDFRLSSRNDLSILFDSEERKIRKEEHPDRTELKRKKADGKKIRICLINKKFSHPFFGENYYAAILPI